MHNEEKLLNLTFNNFFENNKENIKQVIDSRDEYIKHVSDYIGKMNRKLYSVLVLQDQYRKQLKDINDVDDVDDVEEVKGKKKTNKKKTAKRNKRTKSLKALVPKPNKPIDYKLDKESETSIFLKYMNETKGKKRVFYDDYLYKKNKANNTQKTETKSINKQLHQNFIHIVLTSMFDFNNLTFQKFHLNLSPSFSYKEKLYVRLFLLEFVIEIDMLDFQQTDFAIIVNDDENFFYSALLDWIIYLVETLNYQLFPMNQFVSPELIVNLSTEQDYVKFSEKDIKGFLEFLKSPNHCPISNLYKDVENNGKKASGGNSRQTEDRQTAATKKKSFKKANKKKLQSYPKKQNTQKRGGNAVGNENKTPLSSEIRLCSFLEKSLIYQLVRKEHNNLIQSLELKILKSILLTKFSMSDVHNKFPFVLKELKNILSNGDHVIFDTITRMFSMYSGKDIPYKEVIFNTLKLFQFENPISSFQTLFTQFIHQHLELNKDSSDHYFKADIHFKQIEFAIEMLMSNKNEDPSVQNIISMLFSMFLEHQSLSKSAHLKNPIPIFFPTSDISFSYLQSTFLSQIPSLIKSLSPKMLENKIHKIIYKSVLKKTIKKNISFNTDNLFSTYGKVTNYNTKLLHKTKDQLEEIEKKDKKEEEQEINDMLLGLKNQSSTSSTSTSSTYQGGGILQYFNKTKSTKSEAQDTADVKKDILKNYINDFISPIDMWQRHLKEIELYLKQNTFPKNSILYQAIVEKSFLARSILLMNVDVDNLYTKLQISNADYMIFNHLLKKDDRKKESKFDYIISIINSEAHLRFNMDLSTIVLYFQKTLFCRSLPTTQKLKEPCYLLVSSDENIFDKFKRLFSASNTHLEEFSNLKLFPFSHIQKYKENLFQNEKFKNKIYQHESERVFVFECNMKEYVMLINNQYRSSGQNVAFHFQSILGGNVSEETQNNIKNKYKKEESVSEYRSFLNIFSNTKKYYSPNSSSISKQKNPQLSYILLINDSLLRENEDTTKQILSLFPNTDFEIIVKNYQNNLVGRN